MTLWRSFYAIGLLAATRVLEYGLATVLRTLFLFWLAATLATEPVSIEQLGWLSGCWRSIGGETGSSENWTKPAGGSMLATSRVVRNGKTVAYEFLRISETDDGSLVLVAAPSGQASNSFQLASIADQSVTFEDPEHDFPQRLSYTLINAELLHARIEGVSGGELRGVDFPMTRISCDD